jgi:arginine repressor
MIMVRSTSVNATSVAVIVDHLELPAILCTTIGDDTILTIIDTDENRKRVKTNFSM